MNASKPIIIKRVKKKGHAAAHGGSWKVAYADLVTAMMAFFLLLWLLAMVSPEKRLALSNYFNNHSVFKTESIGGKSFMTGSQSVIDAPVTMKNEQGKTGNSKGSAAEVTEAKKVTSEEMAERLKDSINRTMRYLKDQILVDIVEGGVRIQIIDMAGSEMFALGSDVPTQKALKILELVADNIRDVDNRIAVEGHTDSAPFMGGKTTNWELSTSRASAARRVLGRNGIDPDRIARVVGYADQELFIKEDPRDPRNRRISIILLSKGGQPAATVTLPQNIPLPRPVGASNITSGQTPAVSGGATPAK